MNRTFVKILACVMVGVSFSTHVYAWADMYMSFCQSRGIISGDENGDLMPESNLTREQMAKMILNALNIDISNSANTEYEDISPERWSYKYISKYQEYVIENSKYFNPQEEVTREEFLAMTMKVAGFGNYKPTHLDQMLKTFKDYNEIDEKYLNLIATGFEKKCITGSDGMLRPKDKLTRAEACAMFYKIIYSLENDRLYEDYYNGMSQENNKPVDPKDFVTTPEKNNDEYVSNYSDVMLLGEAEATIEQAKKWAEKRGAHQRFIDIADLYWKYGELTGIRADVLYAQAAKETNFGKYTGQVKPEQNNWAGIKKYGATGDLPEDHEDFETPDDGVRGHFNHMSAYVGIAPVGVPHGRYKSVKSLSWAGTVKTVQELGGKWCPTITYGESIIKDYLEPMKAIRVN